MPPRFSIRIDKEFCTVPRNFNKLQDRKQRVRSMYRARGLVLALIITGFVVWTGVIASSAFMMQWSFTPPEEGVGGAAKTNVNALQFEGLPFGNDSGVSSFAGIFEWISYIFSSTSESNFTGDGNMSDFIESLLNNATIMQDVWSAIGKENVTFEELVQYIANGTVSQQIAEAWAKMFVMNLFQQMIPEQLYEPVKLYVINKGFTTLDSIVFNLTLQWDNITNILAYSQITDVPVNGNASIGISIGDVMLNVISIAADYIADEIVNTMMTNGTFDESTFGNVLAMVFDTDQLAVIVDFSSRISWYALRTHAFINIAEIMRSMENGTIGGVA